MPWLRWGVLHYLPVCLLMATAHRVAGCSWPNLSAHFGVLMFDHVAFISASLLMYKHALYNWKRIPHPAWEGFPIFWREGPEHAAAAFSEQLRLLRWYLEWEMTQTMLRCSNKVESEGESQICSKRKSCCWCTSCSICWPH